MPTRRLRKMPTIATMLRSLLTKARLGQDARPRFGICNGLRRTQRPLAARLRTAEGPKMSRSAISAAPMADCSKRCAARDSLHQFDGDRSVGGLRGEYRGVGVPSDGGRSFELAWRRRTFWRCGADRCDGTCPGCPRATAALAGVCAPGGIVFLEVPDAVEYENFARAVSGFQYRTHQSITTPGCVISVCMVPTRKPPPKPLSWSGNRMRTSARASNATSWLRRRSCAHWIANCERRCQRGMWWSMEPANSP